VGFLTSIVPKLLRLAKRAFWLAVDPLRYRRVPSSRVRVGWIETAPPQVAEDFRSSRVLAFPQALRTAQFRSLPARRIGVSFGSGGYREDVAFFVLAIVLGVASGYLLSLGIQ
jgi:hypothetical protein